MEGADAAAVALRRAVEMSPKYWRWKRNNTQYNQNGLALAGPVAGQSDVELH